MKLSELKPGDVFVGDDSYYYLIIQDSSYNKVLCFLTEYSSSKAFIDPMAITIANIANSEKVKPKKYICNIMKPLFKLQLKIQEMESVESGGISDGD